MTAGREIAGFAIPFAAGTAISMAFPIVSTGFPHASFPVLAAIISVCIFILLTSSHKEYHSAALWSAIIISALACGAVCCITADWLAVSGNNSDGWLNSLTEPFGSRLKQTISDLPFKNAQTGALINSLITGDRSGLDMHTKSIFRQSGASHILALSGMHLGIIYGILKLLLSPIGNSRKALTIRSVTTTFICLFYTIMTGAGPSITRAFIFIFLYETAAAVGRKGNTGEILMTSLIIHLTIFPDDIRQVGFLLSYAAMAGIAYIYPAFNKLWTDVSGGPVVKGLKWIWTSASVAIACQITTGPIAYICFGTFPEYFLLTNLLAAPLVGLIIPWGLVVSGLHAAGICPEFLTTGLEFIIQTFTGILEIIAEL